jgi:hypothetical protein
MFGRPGDLSSRVSATLADSKSWIVNYVQKKGALFKLIISWLNRNKWEQRSYCKKSQASVGISTCDFPHTKQKFQTHERGVQ